MYPMDDLIFKPKASLVRLRSSKTIWRSSMLSANSFSCFVCFLFCDICKEIFWRSSTVQSETCQIWYNKETKNFYWRGVNCKRRNLYKKNTIFFIKIKKRTIKNKFFNWDQIIFFNELRWKSNYLKSTVMGMYVWR